LLSRTDESSRSRNAQVPKRISRPDYAHVRQESVRPTQFQNRLGAVRIYPQWATLAGPLGERTQRIPRDLPMPRGAVLGVMRWKQPAHYGSPRGYYESTYDSFSGLHFLGEYPWAGPLEIVVSLQDKNICKQQIGDRTSTTVSFDDRQNYPVDSQMQTFSKEELEAARVLAKRRNTGRTSRK